MNVGSNFTYEQHTAAKYLHSQNGEQSDPAKSANNNVLWITIAQCELSLTGSFSYTKTDILQVVDKFRVW